MTLSHVCTAASCDSGIWEAAESCMLTHTAIGQLFLARAVQTAPPTPGMVLSGLAFLCVAGEVSSS